MLEKVYIMHPFNPYEASERGRRKGFGGTEREPASVGKLEKDFDVPNNSS